MFVTSLDFFVKVILKIYMTFIIFSMILEKCNYNYYAIILFNCLLTMVVLFIYVVLIFIRYFM